MWVGAIAVAGALLVLGPNLPQLGTAALGARWSDNLKHVWSQWWAWRELSAGRAPLHTDLLNAPDGGPFFSLDLANAALGGPLRAALQPVAVYNLLLLVHLIAAFVAAWALARELTGRPGPPLVAGAAFAFSAWVLTFPLASGVSEAAFLWPLPLVLLCARRTLRGPGWGAPVAGAILLVVQAVACTSHALTAGVALLAGGVVWAAGRPWRRPPGDPGRLTAATVRRVGVVLALVALAAAPLYLAVSGTVEHGVYERPLSLFGAFDPQTLPELHAVSVAQLGWPGADGLRVHQGADRLYFTGYLGWALVALAATGLRRPAGRWSLALAAVFIALALGPSISVDLARAGPGWPNPVYLAAWYAMPLFSLSMHGADRFLAGAALALGVAASVGLDSWAPASRRAGWAAGVGAAAVVLVETLALSPAPWPVPQVPALPSPAAALLASGAGPVIDLPFASPDGRFFSEILLDQTAHQRPVPYRLEGRGLQAVHPSVRDNPFFRAAHAASLGPTAGLPCAGAGALADAGFGALVVHPGRLPASSALPEALERCLGPATPLGPALGFDLHRAAP